MRFLKPDTALLDDLKALFGNIHPIPDTEWNRFCPICKALNLEKGQVLAREGESSEWEICVMEGVLRSYYTTYEGDEVTSAFYPGPAIVSPWFARTYQAKSLLNLVAEVPTSLIVFDQREFEGLRYQNMNFREFGTRVVEAELYFRAQKEIMMARLKAKDRYLQFRSLFPQLETQIPQYHIASFLGISPISLSRIRTELARDDKGKAG